MVLGGIITIIITSHQEDRARRVADGTYTPRHFITSTSSTWSRAHLFPLSWLRSRQRHASSNHFTPSPIEKVGTLHEAFAGPLAPFGTPLPSPQPIGRRTGEHESTGPEYHRMDGGRVESSPFPWLLRVTKGRDLDERNREGQEVDVGEKDPRREMPVARKGWKERLGHRFKQSTTFMTDSLPSNDDTNEGDYDRQRELRPLMLDPLRASSYPANPQASQRLNSHQPISEQDESYHTVPTPTINPIYAKFATTSMAPSRTYLPDPTNPVDSTARSTMGVTRSTYQPAPPSQVRRYRAMQASAMAAPRNPFEEHHPGPSHGPRDSAPIQDPFRTPFDDDHEEVEEGGYPHELRP